MPEMSLLPEAPPPHPRQPLRRVWTVVAIVIGLGLLIAALTYPAPYKAMPLWSKPLLAALAGAGIGLPIASLWVNRAQWRAMLRYRHGRLIPALVLSALFPVGFFGGLPTAFGFLMGLFVIGGADAIRRGDTDWITGFMGAALAIHALSYLVACALIYGLHRRWRIGGFSLYYLGQVSVLLALGFYTSLML